MDKLTHLVKLQTDSDPFYAKAAWDKDHKSVEVLLLQKDKAWEFVLTSIDMGAVAKKLQAFIQFTGTVPANVKSFQHLRRWRRAKRSNGCVRPL